MKKIAISKFADFVVELSLDKSRQILTARSYSEYGVYIRRVRRWNLRDCLSRYRGVAFRLFDHDINHQDAYSLYTRFFRDNSNNEPYYYECFYLKRPCRYYSCVHVKSLWFYRYLDSIGFYKLS